MRLLRDKFFVICLLASLLWHILSIAVFSTVLPVRVRSNYKPKESPAIKYMMFAPESIEERVAGKIGMAESGGDVDAMVARTLGDSGVGENLKLPVVREMELEVAVYKRPASSASLITPSSGVPGMKPKSSLLSDLSSVSEPTDESESDTDALECKLLPDKKGLLSMSGEASLRKILSRPDKMVIPDWVEEKGQDFICKIGFSVTKEGAVKSTRILKTSGDSRIDVYGEELVKKFIFEQSRKETESGELNLEIRLRPKFTKEK